MNLQQFYDGTAFDAYTFFGAHVGKEGVMFRTYAPAAQAVAVAGEFSGWYPQPMQQQGQSGVYSLLVPRAKTGMMYKYVITTAEGAQVYHADPYGFGMQLRPESASIITDLKEYTFTDAKWMQQRTKGFDKPVNIYEVHLGSWRTNPANPNGWYCYHEIADELIAYVKEWGYTHIEFMPLSEHPADESWGYQNTGFFSPTSRYGTARDLMELVDKCHAAGIGVIMDFVPVHFAVDGYGLNHYDGSPLYEYPPSDVSGSEWGTLNFIHSRREVACFLQSAANFWLKEFHFDGLRMDAISRAIYWQGQPERGVNPNGIEFFKTMNEGLQRLHPTAILCAEDSTAYVKITAPVKYDGLGFDYKWDLGWMNDTLNYFRTPPEERPAHHHKLTFSMQYFYNEKYILPLSHDEVVHGKATIIQKMWGGYEEKFPQARALYLYMLAHPGKKLNFMGNELAQFREWDEKREQDWDILHYPLHDAFHRYMQELNRLYLSTPALHDGEYNPAAFEWLEANAEAQSVYIFRRGQGKHKIVAAFNFSAHNNKGYKLHLKQPLALQEILCSDHDIYGGGTPAGCSKLQSKPVGAGGHMLSVPIPAFSGRLFKVIE